MNADPPARPGFFARLWASNPVRYVVVGGAAFIIDISLLALFYEVLHIPLAVSTPMAFLLSFAITFLLQRTIAFGSQGKLASSAVRYTILVAANTVATTAIVTSAAALGLPWELGKVIAVGSTTVWNYFAYRHWIFRTRPGEGGPISPDAVPPEV